MVWRISLVLVFVLATFSCFGCLGRLSGSACGCLGIMEVICEPLDHLAQVKSTNDNRQCDMFDDVCLTKG